MIGGSECVALVKDATGIQGLPTDWKPGEKIKGPDDPPLQPGTALATFNKDGKYVSQDTGVHAVIFLGYGEDKLKGPGIVVLEQWGERRDKNGKITRPAQPTREHVIPFEGGEGVDRAKLYSVIKPR